MADDPASASEAPDQLKRMLNRLADAERNLAIQQALLDDRLLRVERNRVFTMFNRAVAAYARLVRRVRKVFPRPAPEDENPADYARWVAHELAVQPSVEAARAASHGWAHKPTISVILTARGGDSLAGCLEALHGQAYGNWELCAAVNRGCGAHFSGLPGRLHSIPADALDDAQALHAAAGLATGEYLSFIEETGILSPLAFYYVAEALQHGPVDVLYSDEDSLDAQGRRVRPRFKPDWSPELLASAPYVGHLLTIRRERFGHAGGFSSDAGDAYLFDLLLRLADGPVNVYHLPQVLYHGPERPATPDSAAQAIARAVTRREQTEATAIPGPAAGTWIARRQRPAADVTAIVCSKSPDLLETCLASLRATAGDTVRQIIVVAHEDSGPNSALHAIIKGAGATAVSFGGRFHFAAMNNLGAAAAHGPNLLFLNDDVRATQPGWAELLSEQVSREPVGIAGAVLWYPTGVLQHAGVVVGIGDGVGHAGRYQPSSQLWPWLLAEREVSAVTGACLAIRKELFERLGGFDLRFPNNYNDVDLCFRARALGYRVICVPAGGLVHAECQSRPGVVQFVERYRFYERWAEVLRMPDPFYSRSLAPTERIALNSGEDNWYRELLEGRGE